MEHVKKFHPGVYPSFDPCSSTTLRYTRHHCIPSYPIPPVRRAVAPRLASPAIPQTDIVQYLYPF